MNFQKEKEKNSEIFVNIFENIELLKNYLNSLYIKGYLNSLEIIVNKKLHI